MRDPGVAGEGAKAEGVDASRPDCLDRRGEDGSAKVAVVVRALWLVGMRDRVAGYLVIDKLRPGLYLAAARLHARGP